MRKGVISFAMGIILAGFLCVIPKYEAHAEEVVVETKGSAFWSASEQCYILTEEKTYQRGALVFSNINCNGDFDVSFDFYSGDADIATRDSYKGADGIGFSFYSNIKDVPSFVEIKDGYSVEIDTYFETNNAQYDPQYNHVGITKDGWQNHLKTANASSYTEDSKWHHMNVKSIGGVVTVYVDGAEVLKQDNIVAKKYSGMMISAPTGLGYNKQKVKNIVVNKAEYKTGQNTSNVKINLSGDAYYDPTENCIVLTEEKTWQGGAIYFPDAKCNYDFDLSFDFYTGDADIAQRDSFKGADGIAVEFYCNMDTGSSQGLDMFFSGRGGYGVEIDTYFGTSNAGFDPQYNHIAFIKDTTDNHLAVADATSFTEDGKWHHIQITNTIGVCKVFIDGRQVLEQKNVYPTGYYTMGITGATGDGINNHKIKNIVLSKAEFNPAGLFNDVNQDEFYYDPVLWAGFNEITTGKNETTFAPNVTCTRGEVVTFLWRLKGKPAARGKSPFTDVQNPSAFYYDAVNWAYENGVTTGVSPTRFAPGKTVTRCEFVTLLHRYLGKPAATAPSPFHDVAGNKYYYNAVSWAASSGVTTGMTPQRFAPNSPCTRGQVVTFLYRANVR